MRPGPETSPSDGRVRPPQLTLALLLALQLVRP